MSKDLHLHFIQATTRPEITTEIHNTKQVVMMDIAQLFQRAERWVNKPPSFLSQLVPHALWKAAASTLWFISLQRSREWIHDVFWVCLVWRKRTSEQELLAVRRHKNPTVKSQGLLNCSHCNWEETSVLHNNLRFQMNHCFGCHTKVPVVSNKWKGWQSGSDLIQQKYDQESTKSI